MNNGGPAFPTDCWEHTEKFSGKIQGGMTLRDYFASKALALGGEHFYSANSKSWDEIAIEAYGIADAMLKARESHD